MIKNDQAARYRRFIAAIVFGDKLIDLATTQTGVGFSMSENPKPKKRPEIKRRPNTRPSLFCIFKCLKFEKLRNVSVTEKPKKSFFFFLV